MPLQPPTPPVPPPLTGAENENFPVPPNNNENQNVGQGNKVPQELAKLVQSVPKEQRAELIGHLLEQFEISESETMSMAKMTHFSGPFPHPDILKGMNEIVPGAAADIIKMGLQQSTHRQQMEHLVIKSQTRQSSTGQWLGFFIALFGLGGSFYLGATGHETTAAIIGGIDLVGLVSVFVIGKSYQKKDLDKKKDE